MAAIDIYEDEPNGFGAPALNGEEVTPHDTNELTFVSRALWVGGAGTLEVVMVGDGAAGGQQLTIAGIPAGTLLPLAVKQVKATGTTATLIVALR